MKALKLRLEPDKTFPQFKRLRWKTEEVSVREIFDNKVYPYQEGIPASNLAEKLISMLNDKKYKISELLEFGYCPDLSACAYSYYYPRKSKFSELMERIESEVFFVETLSVPDLVEISKKHLKDTWSHQKAKSILESCITNFDEIRQFLKSKNDKIKLTGYADLNNYTLDKILSVDDFDGQDTAIISQAFGCLKLRSVNFIDENTDSQGKFQMDTEIREFQLQANERFEESYSSLTYNCQIDGDAIRCHPELKTDKSIRRFAVKVSEKWRIGDGKYCFQTDIERLEKMIAEDYSITFTTLSTCHPDSGKVSFAKIVGAQINGYSVRKIPSLHSTCDHLKEKLRKHGVRSTGRKEVLLDNLSELCVILYKSYEPELDQFFCSRRFIKVDNLSTQDSNDFPVLYDSKISDMRNIILTMYIMKHLRGNVILESSYCIDTFDNLSLAQSLLKREVSLEGYFLELL